MNEIDIKNSTILIVDDNSTNLGVFYEYLNAHGFKILLAQSGKDALEIAKKRKPDLILLDIVMPEMDGYETCSLLKSDKTVEDIPIIFVTALSDLNDKVKGFRSGGVDYLTKPVQREELVARVTAHLTIRYQQKILSEYNASKAKLFSILAHDLMTPFTSLLGFSKILAENSKNMSRNEIADFSDKIHKSLGDLLSLLQNVLEWSRTQTVAAKVVKSEINLKKLSDEIIYLNKLALEDKNIAMNNKLPDNCEIYADERMIKTVVRNLISNAIKFTRQNGKIEIFCREEGNYYEISVVDNGVGIKEENIYKLFNIYENHSTTGTNSEKGTGLGLVLCKDFVEKNGGKIGVESEFNKGSRFFFTINKK